MNTQAAKHHMNSSQFAATISPKSNQQTPQKMSQSNIQPTTPKYNQQYQDPPVYTQQTQPRDLVESQAVYFDNQQYQQQQPQHQQQNYQQQQQLTRCPCCGYDLINLPPIQQRNEYQPQQQNQQYILNEPIEPQRPQLVVQPPQNEFTNTTYYKYLERTPQTNQQKQQPVSEPEFEYIYNDVQNLNDRFGYMQQVCRGVRFTVNQFTSILRLVPNEQRLDLCMNFRGNIYRLTDYVEVFASMFPTKTEYYQFKKAVQRGE